jgi:hypothetical protein
MATSEMMQLGIYRDRTYRSRSWAFKENLKNLASSVSKICQLTRSDKKHNARKIEKTKIQKNETESSGLGICLDPAHLV